MRRSERKGYAECCACGTGDPTQLRQYRQDLRCHRQQAASEAAGLTDHGKADTPFPEPLPEIQGQALCLLAEKQPAVGGKPRLAEQTVSPFLSEFPSIITEAAVYARGIF